MNECEFFAKVKSLIAQLSDQRLHAMLSEADEILEHLTKTRYYKSIETDIRNGDLSFELLKGVADGLDENQTSIVVWLTGFRVASEERNPNHMLMQTCMFVAAQRLSVFRITDDKIRLAITHVHIEALERFIADKLK